MNRTIYLRDHARPAGLYEKLDFGIPNPQRIAS